jgi:prevent-host-death family protein
MKTLQVSQDILPIAKFKAHASEVIHRVKREGRPTVITLNGEPAAVLISPADFDRMGSDAGLSQAIEEGLADVEAGRTVSDAEFKRWANKRFGAFRKTLR